MNPASVCKLECKDIFLSNRKFCELNECQGVPVDLIKKKFTVFNLLPFCFQIQVGEEQRENKREFHKVINQNWK